MILFPDLLMPCDVMKFIIFKDLCSLPLRSSTPFHSPMPFYMAHVHLANEQVLAGWYN
jgi:hypothetical protein